MDFETFKKALEGLTNGSELFEFYTAQVNKERDIGIEEKRKANSEAQNLRKYKKALENIGFNREAEELEPFIETLKASKVKAGELDTTKLSLDSVNAELADLRDKFMQAQNELTSEKKAREAIALDAKKKTLKAKLTEALRDKVYGHDFVADSLINDSKIDLENDNPYFKDGDKKVSFEDGLKKLLEERTDILKNTQKPGANTSPNNSTNKKSFTREEVAKMSAEEIRANLATINSSLSK
jgi:hypothetical protein